MGDLVELTQVLLFDVVLRSIKAVDRFLVSSWYS